MYTTTRPRSLQQPRLESRRSALLLACALLISACSADDSLITEDELVDRLLEIDGMLSVEERDSGNPDYRLLSLVMAQPVDHDAPDGLLFGQHISLMHRAIDAPTVLVSTGYYDFLVDRLAEPTEMLAANQLVVEHRFFAASRPTPAEWQYLTIEQAATDHHRVIEALSPIYRNAWVSTGVSKGGMTSLFHRRFYPDDVAATLAYVAPISFAAPDPRYVPFFATVGDDTGHGACREKIKAVQREALLRRSELLPLLSDYAEWRGYSFERMGGLDVALEVGVAEAQWGFWQYQGIGECEDVPEPQASAQDIMAFLEKIGSIGLSDDAFLDAFEPYYLQAATELGYPDGDYEHIADLLLYDPGIAPSLPPDTTPVYDPAAMLDMAEWARTDLARTIFIYGANDPWSAGAYDVAGNDDVRSYFAVSGTHGAEIADLSEPERSEIAGLIETWTGLSMSLSTGLSGASARVAEPGAAPVYLPPGLPASGLSARARSR